MICGVFLGGLSSRMGEPKALMIAPTGETVLARTCRVAREAGLVPVLVGPRPEIVAKLEPEHESLARIEDAALERGPLGGLVALLRFAGEGRVLALACDMPHVEPETLASLVRAAAGPAIVAPRRDGTWEPLFAVYDVARVLPLAEARLADGALGLQGLLEACGAVAIAVPARELFDWDTLSDVAQSRGDGPRNS